MNFLLKKVFFFLILFPFFLFSSDVELEIFSSISSINQKTLDLEIDFDVPSGWLLYSDKKSVNGSPLTITLNDKSENIKKIEILFPESIKEHDDFFYTAKEKILINCNFKNQATLNESDFLIASYIMCNKKSGECVKNLQNIALQFKNNT